MKPALPASAPTAPLALTGSAPPIGTTATPSAPQRVALMYQFTTSAQRSAHLGNPLLDLLQAVRQQGSISGAARQLGLSYRHVWGQLKDWEVQVGQPLIVWDRGQSARLTPFADKLLWAERLAQARLAPQIEALRAELERALATVFDERTQVLSLHASHDDALARLQDHAAAQHRLHLDIQFSGSVDAIRALNEGRCQLAGFHTRQHPAARTLTARTYKPLLKPGHHKIIGFALRWVGLLVPHGNPRRLHSLADVVRQQAVLVKRPLGTGTRVLLDEMLADLQASTGMDTGPLPGGTEATQPSHAAVAQAVASGQADVGLGTQTAAMAAGLGFVPLVQERYQLVCLKSALDSPPVQTLRTALASAAWTNELAQLPGYTPDQSGTVQAMNRLLPWWAFR